MAKNQHRIHRIYTKISEYSSPLGFIRRWTWDEIESVSLVIRPKQFICTCRLRVPHSANFVVLHKLQQRI
jgi:hypothetical protein